MSLPPIETPSALDFTARPQSAERAGGPRAESDDSRFAETLNRATESSERPTTREQDNETDGESPAPSDPAVSTEKNEPSEDATATDNESANAAAAASDSESDTDTASADVDSDEGEDEALAAATDFVLLATPDQTDVTPEIAAAETSTTEDVAAQFVVTTETAAEAAEPVSATPVGSTTQTGTPSPDAVEAQSASAATKPAETAAPQAQPDQPAAESDALATSPSDQPPSPETTTTSVADPNTEAQTVAPEPPAAATGEGNQQDQRRQQSTGGEQRSETPVAQEAAPLESATDAKPTSAAEVIETLPPATNADSAGAEPAADSPKPQAPAASLTEVAAGRLPTGRAQQSSGDETTLRVDPARFVARVSRAIQSAADRGGEVRLRLSPPELGTVQIKLSLGEGAMTATLETDNANARNLLLDNLPALRERLAEQEIRIEKFDVDVRQDGQASQQEQAEDDDRPSSTTGRSDQTKTPTTDITEQSPLTANPAIGGDGAINLVA
ncbi:MAG: flagellar hook-length control protein FliK [Planctomycetota bacterium]